MHALHWSFFSQKIYFLKEPQKHGQGQSTNNLQACCQQSRTVYSGLHLYRLYEDNSPQDVLAQQLVYSMTTWDAYKPNVNEKEWQKMYTCTFRHNHLYNRKNGEKG